MQSAFGFAYRQQATKHVPMVSTYTVSSVPMPSANQQCCWKL